MNLLFSEGCIAKRKDGKTVLYLVNPSEQKEQLQYFYNSKWWYIELLWWREQSSWNDARPTGRACGRCEGMYHSVRP